MDLQIKLYGYQRLSFQISTLTMSNFCGYGTHLLMFFMWTAKIGAQTYETCAELMGSYHRYSLSDGVYTITSTTLGSLNLYCSFDYINEYAWTLFESGTRGGMQAMRDTGFSVDAERNTGDVDAYRFTIYRLSYDWMDYLQSNSDYLFATCEFNTSLVEDYMLFDVSQFDIFSLNNSDTSICSSGHIFTNINGVSCGGSTIAIVGASEMHPHLSQQSGCDCTIFGTSGEDYFGCYWSTDASFTCTTSGYSTTQWWYGSNEQLSSIFVTNR